MNNPWEVIGIIALIQGLIGIASWKWVAHMQDVLMICQGDIKDILEKMGKLQGECERCGWQRSPGP